MTEQPIGQVVRDELSKLAKRLDDLEARPEIRYLSERLDGYDAFVTTAGKQIKRLRQIMRLQQDAGLRPSPSDEATQP